MADLHPRPSCPFPKITRTFRHGAIWACPYCGRLWQASNNNYAEAWEWNRVIYPATNHPEQVGSPKP